MAETYESDDEVTRFKAWLAENGLPLITGLVVGLAIVLGWQGWDSYKTHQSQEASQRYNQLQQAVQGQDLEAAEGMLAELREDYRGTPYAALGSLQLGGAYARKDQMAQADDHLKWVVSYAADDKIRNLARLRRARLLWARGDNEQALEVLQDAKPAPAMQPLFAELRGDLLVSLSRPDEAREAYLVAMQSYASPAERALVEQKLDDLAAAAPNAAAGDEPASEAEEGNGESTEESEA